MDYLADGKGLALLDKIAAAKLLRRESDGRGDSVEMAFEREDALRRAKPAKRAVRRGVRCHHAALNQHVGAGVRSGGVNGASGQHNRR